jgi:phosphate transport system protein
MLARYIEKEQHVIRQTILDMGQTTCKAIEDALESYITQNVELADAVAVNDALINDLQSKVEAECINLLATQQPVAKDLREILTDINIAKELERIADYAVSIASEVHNTVDKEHAFEPEIKTIANKCIAMFNEVMNDYAEKDAQKAKNCARKDDEIDQLIEEFTLKLFREMEQNPALAVVTNYKLRILHKLERIGDRITNMAEGIVFLSTGKDVSLD